MVIEGGGLAPPYNPRYGEQTLGISDTSHGEESYVGEQPCNNGEHNYSSDGIGPTNGS